MMTNNPNANLIEAMKEKLPLKGQLADMLMDTLYIGKEAVYRRLRGEVPFTLQESALISRKLGISLDKIIGLSFKSINPEKPYVPLNKNDAFQKVQKRRVQKKR